MRLPPTIDPQIVSDALKRVVEETPPYNSSVHYQTLVYGNGFYAPKYSASLEAAVKQTALSIFGQEPQYWGVGGFYQFYFSFLLQQKYSNNGFASIKIS